MKILIGIFLCFFIFSSTGAVIEDMAVNSPYAPFPWPCDSLADCAYTDEENISLPVIEIENFSLAQDEWSYDSNEDSSNHSNRDHWIPASAGAKQWNRQTELLSRGAGITTPQNEWNHDNVKQPFFNEYDSMDSPYAPFPWPCDSLADCAYISSENVIPPFFNEANIMDSPYAPFPWPCDSLADCAYMDENRQQPMASSISLF